ncbi:chitin synthase III catalytic subunit-domain-containing protein [Melanogaster broomeanus]|nr:chitin synthase III catalytic subunit-domain-containing protein [Melanogaster broomeanus]
MGLSFGSFDGICSVAALVICPLLGSSGQGMEPTCYSRNVQVGSTLIFQPATCFVHIVAILMTAIMIYHIRSKYTAVGRKEIVMFFWMYMIIELLAMFLDSGIIPTANVSYPWFAAAYTGLVAAAYCCLLINGFVGFQFAEDGTPHSLWLLRLSCFFVFGVAFFVAIATFKSFASFSPTKPVGLFVVYLLWPILCVATYTISQLILVFRTLDDRWPIGDIIFGIAFYAIAQVLLFAVMMVYKYWDSITREDLEFSVGSKAAVWEVKDPLLAASGPPVDFDEDTTSNYHAGTGASLVGGVSGNQYYGGKGGYPQGGYGGPQGGYGGQQGGYGVQQGGYGPQGGYGGPQGGYGGPQAQGGYNQQGYGGAPRAYPPTPDRY